MSIISKRIIAAAGAGVAALAAGTLAAAPAAAAPLPVQQVPAQGILSMGLGNWSGYAASIRIETTGRPGQVALSAPGGAACGRGAAGTLVRFDYTNLTTGRAGSGTVRPCTGPFSGPLKTTLHTGAGQIVGAINIVGSGGPWQIPGGATFGVPR
ncbi:hypothetical protein MUG78_12730 [Gordonia alkaliphila]|uniref:hypothetical protein n=1 Tax=Gordonia alkaliphila TaxID=1053547 RepID=UPI001FF31B22|nr:hypothetical protein [Gordonia alkaliphila]MCK0440289.1 hypothetical protein [Gordonia alkaliphila]